MIVHRTHTHIHTHTTHDNLVGRVAVPIPHIHTSCMYARSCHSSAVSGCLRALNYSNCPLVHVWLLRIFLQNEPTQLSSRRRLFSRRTSHRSRFSPVPACTHGAGVRACRCLAWSTVTKGHPMHVFRRFPTRTAASRTSEPMLRASTSDESRASSITASPCGVGSRGTGGSLRRRFRHPQASMA